MQTDICKMHQYIKCYETKFVGSRLVMHGQTARRAQHTRKKSFGLEFETLGQVIFELPISCEIW
jgi:hypothetical protein